MVVLRLADHFLQLLDAQLARQVEDRALRCRDRNPAVDRDFAWIQFDAMKADARALAPRGRDHSDPPPLGQWQFPKFGRCGKAQAGIRATGEHRRHQLSLARNRAMPDRIDAEMQRMQPRGLDALADRID